MKMFRPVLEGRCLYIMNILTFVDEQFFRCPKQENNTEFCRKNIT